MMLTPILATGLNGLVGSKLSQDLADRYQFDNLDLRDEQRPVDITQADQVEAAISRSPAQFLIHLAAFTNVSAAWNEREQKDALCYQVNVEGTRNIAQACLRHNKHLIHISTAYVFDGQKTDPYTEDDPVKPIEWYGQTKAWAEEVVENLDGLKWTILRIDQPFRSDPFAKLDIVHRLMEGIKGGDLYPQFTDHYFGPTFIDDFVKIIDLIIKQQVTGLFHASSGEQWTDYDFAKLIAQQINPNFTVKPGSLAEYLKSSQRPYQKNTAMSVDKLKAQLNFELTPISQALQSIS